jgi:hypothetical protein
LRLVLTGISPLIWRRLLLSSETSIAQLHEYTQICFDWSGEHLASLPNPWQGLRDRLPRGHRLRRQRAQVPLSRFRLHPRESFRYEYDFTANWRVNIRLEKIVPQPRRQPLPFCTSGGGAAPWEECPGVLAYLQRLDRHRYEFPFEELGMVAKAVGRWLEAGADDGQAVGDLEELREAAERLTAYQEFQPRRCDRREINRRLRALGQEAAA